MSFSEWGLAIRSDGHGGGDDPYFIQKMHDWISSNNVAYAVYFEYDAPDGQHKLTDPEFPKGAAAFTQLFGGSQTATAAQTTVAKTTTAQTTTAQTTTAQTTPAQTTTAQTTTAQTTTAQTTTAQTTTAQTSTAQTATPTDTTA